MFERNWDFDFRWKWKWEFLKEGVQALTRRQDRPTVWPSVALRRVPDCVVYECWAAYRSWWVRECLTIISRRSTLGCKPQTRPEIFKDLAADLSEHQNPNQGQRVYSPVYCLWWWCTISLAMVCNPQTYRAHIVSCLAAGDALHGQGQVWK